MGEPTSSAGFRRGTFLGMANCKRTEPFTLGMAACIAYLGRGAAAAVVLNDEEVRPGPPDFDALRARFELAPTLCAAAGIHLVDWIGCDDDNFRSTRMAIDPDGEWWDVPKIHRRLG